MTEVQFTKIGMEKAKSPGRFWVVFFSFFFRLCLFCLCVRRRRREGRLTLKLFGTSPARLRGRWHRPRLRPSVQNAAMVMGTDASEGAFFFFKTTFLASSFERPSCIATFSDSENHFSNQSSYLTCVLPSLPCVHFPVSCWSS